MRSFVITGDVGLGKRQREVLDAIGGLNTSLARHLAQESAELSGQEVKQVGICIRCLPALVRYRKRPVQYSAEMRGLYADAIVDGESVLSDFDIDIPEVMSKAINAALADIEAFAKRESVRISMDIFRSALRAGYEASRH